MNPDVVEGIENLRAKGILSEVQAAPFLRVASRQLVSVRPELQALLYVGVLAATTGVGLFLKENHQRLGPASIAALLGAAAAACLVYVARRSPPFSWQRVEAPHVAADYVLLLGALLLASDLAYVETQFRVLGPRWPYHLLLVSLIFLAAAYRFDSRAVLSLALTSFASFRGPRPRPRRPRGSPRPRQRRSCPPSSSSGACGRGAGRCSASALSSRSCRSRRCATTRTWSRCGSSWPGAASR